MKHWVSIYVVPGAVLSSVIMGGGYGTGREVVEFFTRFGVVGGLLGIAVSALIFAAVLAITFEFSRLHQAHDYKRFFHALIGPFWPAFELLYALLFLLVLGVISAAAAEILQDQLGVHRQASTFLMLATVAMIVVAGRAIIEKTLTAWCLLMYAVFLGYFITVCLTRGSGIVAGVRAGIAEPGWISGALLYPMYNLAVIPAMLFVTRRFSSRRNSIGSACVAALLIVMPAAMFHISYASDLPAILSEAVPNYWMIGQLDYPFLTIVFVIALLGTLVETGVGLVHGFVERVQSMLYPSELQELKRSARFCIAAAALSIAAVLSSLGVVLLIAKGYSLLAVGFALIYILPICTLGLIRVLGFTEPKETPGNQL